MSSEEKYDLVESVVRKYYNENKGSHGFGILSDADQEHIIHTAVDVMLAKWKLNIFSVSRFALAVGNNDLTGAFGSADRTNEFAMKFHVQMAYNLGMPRALAE